MVGMLVSRLIQIEKDAFNDREKVCYYWRILKCSLKKK